VHHDPVSDRTAIQPITSVPEVSVAASTFASIFRAKHRLDAEQQLLYFQILLSHEPVLVIDPSASKKSAPHHVLSEQIDDRNQYGYKQNPCNDDPG
jgi:hypothetical protein